MVRIKVRVRIRFSVTFRVGIKIVGYSKRIPNLAH